MFRIVMMELGIELIMLWSSPGRWNLLFYLLTSINPNFDWMPIVRSALPNHSDSSNMDANYLLNLPPSGLTRLVAIGMLVRSRDGCSVKETHRRSSSQSNHRESDQRHNHNTLGNSIPYEESESSSHKRKSQEKETHFEQQSIAIQNGSPKRQAVNRASRYSSCLSSVTDHDVMDSTHMGAQPSVESISTQPLSSFSSIENIKLLFDNLIALPLEDLSHPEKETSMKKTLSILADNLSLFSEEQGDQLLELLFDFPALVRRWREYSRSHKDSQKSSAETENIRELVKTSMKDEESLKVRYEELEEKEKELIRQLEVVQKEKAEIAEQRTEKSNQTRDLMEKAAHRKKDKRLMRIVATKLNNLSDQWAKLQSVFI